MNVASNGIFPLEDSLSFAVAQPDDIEAIIRFMISAGDGLYETLFENLEGQSTADWLKRLVLDMPSGYTVSNWRLACVDDRAIGGICLCPAILLKIGVNVPLTEEGTRLSQSFDCLYSDAPTSYHIVSLALHHLYQRFHIASTLIHLARAEAKLRGYLTLSLFVRADNQTAYEFYRQQGFTLLKETPQMMDSLPPFHLLTAPV